MGFICYIRCFRKERVDCIEFRKGKFEFSTFYEEVFDDSFSIEFLVDVGIFIFVFSSCDVI